MHVALILLFLLMDYCCYSFVHVALILLFLLMDYCWYSTASFFVSALRAIRNSIALVVLAYQHSPFRAEYFGVTGAVVNYVIWITWRVTMITKSTRENYHEKASICYTRSSKSWLAMRNAVKNKPVFYTHPRFLRHFLEIYKNSDTIKYS